jgi:hypothetical protein
MTPRPLTVQWARIGASRLPLRRRSQQSTTPATDVDTTVTATRSAVPAASPPTTSAERRQDVPEPEQARGQQGRGEHAPAAAQLRQQQPPEGELLGDDGPQRDHDQDRPQHRPPEAALGLREGLAHGSEQVGHGVGRPDQRRRGRAPAQARRPGRTGQPQVGRREPAGAGDREQARGQHQPDGQVGVADGAVDDQARGQRGEREPDGPGPSRMHATPPPPTANHPQRVKTTPPTVAMMARLYQASALTRPGGHPWPIW